MTDTMTACAVCNNPEADDRHNMPMEGSSGRHPYEGACSCEESEALKARITNLERALNEALWSAESEAAVLRLRAADDPPDARAHRHPDAMAGRLDHLAAYLQSTLEDTAAPNRGLR